MTANRVYLEREFGWFLGNLDNNQQHRHYALQLSIPIHSTLKLTSKKGQIETTLPVLIKPNIEHQVLSGERQLLLLFNPASGPGHFWSRELSEPIGICESISALELQKLASEVDFNTGVATIFTERLNQKIRSYDCFCTTPLHRGDNRINKALGYLQLNSERVVPVKEVADHCHLSSGRFLHLFREHTGITYRRCQLWGKLTNAIPLLKNKSLTEAAHAAGFSDSAHFSRTFKENFGFSPRDFIKVSRFIQV